MTNAENKKNFFTFPLIMECALFIIIYFLWVMIALYVPFDALWHYIGILVMLYCAVPLF